MKPLQTALFVTAALVAAFFSGWSYSGYTIYKSIYEHVQDGSADMAIKMIGGKK